MTSDVTNNQGDLREVSTCMLNECTCPNGTPVPGSQCVTNQGNQCQSCAAGFHHNQDLDRCEANDCVCEGGTAVTGQLCTEHGATICSSCNQYNQLVGNACQTRRRGGENLFVIHVSDREFFMMI